MVFKEGVWNTKDGVWYLKRVCGIKWVCGIKRGCVVFKEGVW